MTVTITPASPGGLVGPGIPLHIEQVETPVPGAVGYRLVVQSTPLPGLVGWVEHTGEFLPQLNYVLGTAVNESVTLNPPAVLTNDTPVELTALVVNGQGQSLDVGNVPAQWDTTAGLPFQWQHPFTSGGGQSGLTPTEAQQLEQTHQSTFPDTLLDELGLAEITAGPSPGPIDQFLPGFTWGCVVRIDTVPPDLVPNTPDGDYWVPSLAVVRLFRGSDMWLRVPIHTSTKMINFQNESAIVGITAVTFTQWLLNMHLRVWFREGVTGRVFLMTTP